MLGKKILKAYEWDNEIDGYSMIVYAETVGKAKYEVMNEESQDNFTDIRVKRMPWADKYAGGKIPAEEYISHGWWMPCANPKCGNDHLDEESLSKGAGIIDHKIYCPECYLKMKEKS
jgi:hypothetical protein